MSADYWDYPTGSNSVPDGIDFSGDTAFEAVFDEGFNQGFPNAATNVGLPSPYGTFGQGGNVNEWHESAYDGVNDSPSENRVIRSGDWSDAANGLRSSGRNLIPAPTLSDAGVGFRVASVPEPSSVILLILGAAASFTSRRRAL